MRREERALLVGRFDRVHELAVGRQIALAHHRGDGDLEVDLAEQRDVVVVLVRVVGRGERGGETDDEGLPPRGADAGDERRHDEAQ